LEIKITEILKVKVKSLCVVPCHEGIWGDGVAWHILNLGTSGGEWSVSCHGHFTPGERGLSTHWRGQWLDPRVSLDTVAKREKKNLFPAPARNWTPI